jgi:low affinity Fe/Cu permease
MARPSAFLIVIVFTAMWAVIQPDTLDWHGAATLFTWLMTLFIQRSEHRDTQALHAKLDELLRADGKARSELTRLDDEEPEEVERVRDAQRDT